MSIPSSDTPNAPRRVMRVFTLVMINVIAVDSIRSIPFSATYGFSLVFLYLLAGVAFFFPSALVAAELATAWPETGGVYIWVREAFGKPWAFTVVWLQWLYNICWYPTILALLATSVAYLINPAWAQNRVFMVSTILGLYWLTTLLNCYGMRISGALSSFSAIVGTLCPLFLLSILGLVWWWLGNPLRITLDSAHFFPEMKVTHWVFFTNILYSLVGIEMSAVHAQEVDNPRRNYPKALLYSSVIIFFTLAVSSLAVAFVVPQQQLNLVSGLLDAYRLFFKAFDLEGFLPVIVLMIIIGGLGSLGAWVIGPCKALYAAAQDKCIPQALCCLNAHRVPTRILMVQGGLFTVLCLAYVLMPSINSGFWILSDLTAQLALVLYIFMFAAAIRLRYTHANTPRAYRVPFGNVGIWVVGVSGIILCLLTIAIGFIPPKTLDIGNIYVYESILATGFFGFTGLPLLLYWHFNRTSRQG